MSRDLTRAIYQRLTGAEALTGDYLTAQQTLAGLLATDKDTGLPAIHKGNSSLSVDYPCLTFRENAGTVDKRFTQGISAVGLVSVDEPIYDFEVWGAANATPANPAPASTSGALTQMSAIDDCFKLLLDQRYGAPLLPLPNGRVDRMVTLVTPSALYDKNRHAWFLLRRIQFKERTLA